MLKWYDFLILVLLLLTSTLIGIYYGYFSTPMTTTEYFAGNKKMRILPIAISVTIGHFSAIALIGIPADAYLYGAVSVIGTLSIPFILAAALFIYYPALFKTKSSSIFEYLENRFDYKTRLLSCWLYIFNENIVLPAVIYTSSLAIAFGFNMHLISLIICGTCMFYTAVGGLKTVILTDLLQFLIVMISMFLLCGFGIKSAGGFTELWNTALTGGRLDIFDFDLDPTKKDTFWILFIGTIVSQLHQNCLVHSSVQKYMTLPRMRDCAKALLVYGGVVVVVRVVSNFIGVIIYGIYADCDPLLSHQISRPDQIVSYYIDQIASNIPGILGLYITALVSAAISSLASSLNALSHAIYNNFILNKLKSNAKEISKVRILKMIVILESILCTGLVSIVPYLGDILPMVFATVGIVDGPATALFTLGVLFPQVNSNGAFFGTIFGILFMTSIYIPSKYYLYNKGFSYERKPLTTEGCSNFNLTLSNNLNQTVSNNLSNRNMTTKNKPFFLFRISYNYYAVLGAIITIIAALIIDWLEKRFNKSNLRKARKNLDATDKNETQPFVFKPI